MFGFKKKDKAPALTASQLQPRIKHLNFLRALREAGVPADEVPYHTPLCGELLVTYAFDRLDKMVPDPVERQKVLDALNDDKVTKVYAQGDGQSETSGIIYNVINKKGNTDVVIGDPWTP